MLRICSCAGQPRRCGDCARLRDTVCEGGRASQMRSETRVERRTWIWAAVLLAVGVGLCAVPRFDLLGFEFSFVVGLVAAVAGAHLGAQAVWRTRRDQSRSDGERADARPLHGVFATWLRVTATVWALLALPLAC